MMASRSWPHGTTTTLSAVVVVPVGAPVVLVPEVLAMLAVVSVEVIPAEVAVVAVVPVVALAVMGLGGLVVVSVSARATVATDSTLNTATTAATTLRIGTLRLMRILPHCLGGLYVYLWLTTLSLRVFFPSLG